MNINKKIPLVEVFGPTIQGEGAVIGQQTYFLRFGLCDMRCGMCDSMHAVEPMQVKQNARWLTQQQIFDEFGVFRKPNTTNWVTLSGGNPCIHDLEHLVSMLHYNGIKIAVETQGTLCPAWLQYCDIITVSPKGPGMKEECDLEKLDAFVCNEVLRRRMNFKVVVFDQRDLEFAKMLYERYCIEARFNIPFYLSQGNPFPPSKAHDLLTWDVHVETLRDGYENLLNQVSNDPILSNVKLLPQFHVWLWGNKQGV